MDNTQEKQNLAAGADGATAPDWAKIREEVHCPLCDYNLRGISEARCPECGYRFEWPDLLTRRFYHPYLFEHARRRRVKAFLKTLVRNFHPGEFWTTVRPHMDTNAAGLFFYWLICAMLAALPAILTILFPLLDRLWSPRGPPTYTYIWSPRPPAYSWTESIESVLARDQGQIVLVCLGIAIYPLLSAGALMLFHESMHRAKVLPRHVMRIGIYSGDSAVWNGLWILLSVFILAWDPNPFRRSSALMPWVAFGILCMFILTTFRIRSAYASYMKFPNPAGAAILSQIVVFLLLAVSWIPLFQEGFETFRRLLH